MLGVEEWVAPIAALRFYDLETTDRVAGRQYGNVHALEVAAHCLRCVQLLVGEVGGYRIEHETDDDRQGKQQSEAKQRATRPPGMTEMLRHAHRRSPS